MTETRRFSLQDCQEFGRLSGDRNPLHVDETVARRVIAGRVLVHGANLILTAVEVLPMSIGKISSITCDFLNPVCVHDDVTFSASETQSEVKVVVSVRGLTCAVIRLAGVIAPTAESESETVGRLPWGLDVPYDLPMSEWLGNRYEVPLAGAEIEALFPVTSTRIGASAVRAIATISYIVGMLCPGADSMSSAYHLTSLEDMTDEGILSFSVTDFDSRFQLATLRLSGALVGVVKAFVRPRPVTQPTLVKISGMVEPNEFVAQRALIVGGSRGLGEVTAKLLAAGGADVVITWADGRDDASRVAEELRSAGRRCTVERFRAGIDNAYELLQRVGRVSTIYYFATPRIFKKGTPVFDPLLHAQFSEIFISSFARLCQAADASANGEVVLVFFPSTTAIDSRPKGLTEYAAAKAAAELLADDLNRSLRGVRIVRQRLPRVLTDQTASVVVAASSSADEVMLPVLRQMGNQAPSDSSTGVTRKGSVRPQR